MAKSSTSWKSGQSGNPSGRPKLVAEVRDLARQHSPRAIERLVELMEADSGTTAVAACKELLDRGYGRAPQYIEQTIDDNRPEDADAFAPDTAQLMKRLRRSLEQAASHEEMPGPTEVSEEERPQLNGGEGVKPKDAANGSTTRRPSQVESTKARSNA